MFSPLVLELSFGCGAVAILRPLEIPTLPPQFLLAVTQSLILFLLLLFQGLEISFRGLKRLPRRTRLRFRSRLRSR